MLDIDFVRRETGLHVLIRDDCESRLKNQDMTKMQRISRSLNNKNPGFGLLYQNVELFEGLYLSRPGDIQKIGCSECLNVYELTYEDYVSSKAAYLDSIEEDF